MVSSFLLNPWLMGFAGNIGPVIFLSILETSIAIIAASLPMLCKLLGTVHQRSTDIGAADVDLSVKTAC
ncbi:hypothetical protein MAPG_01474 [Magnaporthiopsis poae ATCC 64411]|uniref:Uncharacterized protein n=1 Tax=Magnaporthiopsis poae (strain ATCC 64411 / 73-15) TaxID=644358 RepID=A0A0C4DNS9_MAGP6|nr:hypothetical protein MAPG_01474 [Magnaporthiopsis poae ATCC 64411]